MKGRQALVLCLTVAASLALATSAMGAVAIGSNLSSTPNDNMPGCGNAGLPCTALTFDAPPSLVASGGLRSPVTGVVTSWKFKSASSSPAPSISLRVLQPTSGLSFTGAGTSTPRAPAFGINGPFLTNLPIKAGDAIGLDSSSGSLILSDSPSATMDWWQVPNLADGQTRMGTATATREVMVQAIVEPTSTTTTKPVQTLGAQKRQKLAKAAVTDILDKSGTVSLRAKVNVPSGSHPHALRLVARAVKSKKSSVTLAAQTRTKIRIKFSQSARNKIKAAIAATRKPRKVVVTSTATDSFGNSSTGKVRFKLVG
jgi:hypothetical protein